MAPKTPSLPGAATAAAKSSSDSKRGSSSQRSERSERSHRSQGSQRSTSSQGSQRGSKKKSKAAAKTPIQGTAIPEEADITPEAAALLAEATAVKPLTNLAIDKVQAMTPGTLLPMGSYRANESSDDMEEVPKSWRPPKLSHRSMRTKSSASISMPEEAPAAAELPELATALDAILPPKPPRDTAAVDVSDPDDAEREAVAVTLARSAIAAATQMVDSAATLTVAVPESEPAVPGASDASSTCAADTVAVVQAAGPSSEAAVSPPPSPPASADAWHSSVTFSETPADDGATSVDSQPPKFMTLGSVGRITREKSSVTRAIISAFHEASDERKAKAEDQALVNEALAAGEAMLREMEAQSVDAEAATREVEAELAARSRP